MIAPTLTVSASLLINCEQYLRLEYFISKNFLAQKCFYVVPPYYAYLVQSLCTFDKRQIVLNIDIGILFTKMFVYSSVLIVSFI